MLKLVKLKESEMKHLENAVLLTTMVPKFWEVWGVGVKNEIYVLNIYILKSQKHYSFLNFEHIYM